MSMPAQGKDKKEGVYATPMVFLKKLQNIFPLAFDLACSDENNVIVRLNGRPNIGNNNGFGEKENSLARDWPKTSPWFYNWLNPPYSNIEDWVKKAKEEADKGARTVMLLPASQGSNWFTEWVEPYAVVVELIGRLTFEGHKTVYPKDLILAVYGNNMKGRLRWDWRK